LKNSARKILICDDDKDITEVTTVILEQEGFQVNYIHSCDRIFEIIAEYKPDLILMDLRIPKIGGEEITKEIKGNKKTKKIPVLVFSANHRAEKIADEIGADGFVNKPYDIDDLITKVKSSLR
jgi:DNA-binding response OmpR family regulator